jgi:hypothetical protein
MPNQWVSLTESAGADSVGYLIRSAMPRCVEGVFNPEGWQRVAGGRSRAQTPGRESVGVHPEGMPEFYDPSRVGRRFSIIGPGVSLRYARPPATLWQAFSLRRGRDQAELSLRWTRRCHRVCISAPLAASH